jgi:predicted GIY-YIG superfamily endonuclease
VEVVFCEETQTIEQAFRLERQIKGWRRARKAALARGEYDALVELARTAKMRT